MKLIFCQCCRDIRKLKFREIVLCNCKAVGGVYLDSMIAVISQEAIPLGFNNRSFSEALHKRPVEGEGYDFNAFTIPEECTTVVRLDRIGQPVLVDAHHIRHDHIVGLLLGSLHITYELYRATKDYYREVGNHPKHLGSDAGKGS